MKTIAVILALAFASSTAMAACKTNFLFGVCKTVKDRNNAQHPVDDGSDEQKKPAPPAAPETPTK